MLHCNIFVTARLKYCKFLVSKHEGAGPRSGLQCLEEEEEEEDQA